MLHGDSDATLAASEMLLSPLGLACAQRLMRAASALRVAARTRRPGTPGLCASHG